MMKPTNEIGTLRANGFSIVNGVLNCSLSHASPFAYGNFEAKRYRGLYKIIIKMQSVGFKEFDKLVSFVNV